MERGSYFHIGAWLGGIAATLTFVGSWWYCAATYGFLLGFGLGWIPATIAASLVGIAIMLLWGLIVIAVLLVLVLAWWSSSRGPDRREDTVTEQPERYAPIVSENAVILPGPNHDQNGPALQDGDIMIDRDVVYVRANGRWAMRQPKADQ